MNVSIDPASAPSTARRAVRAEPEHDPPGLPVEPPDGRRGQQRRDERQPGPQHQRGADRERQPVSLLPGHGAASSDGRRSLHRAAARRPRCRGRTRRSSGRWRTSPTGRRCGSPSAPTRARSPVQRRHLLLRLDVRRSGRRGACSSRPCVSSVSRIGSKMPGSSRAEVVVEDQVERRPRLRLVLVVPARVVPARGCRAPARRSART